MLISNPKKRLHVSWQNILWLFTVEFHDIRIYRRSMRWGWECGRENRILKITDISSSQQLRKLGPLDSSSAFPWISRSQRLRCGRDADCFHGRIEGRAHRIFPATLGTWLYNVVSLVKHWGSQIYYFCLTIHETLQMSNLERLGAASVEVREERPCGQRKDKKNRWR